MSIFVICHDGMPEYSLPDGSTVMWLSSRAAPKLSGCSVVPGYDFFPDPEETHRKLSGAMGSIAIHSLLTQQSNVPDKLTIWQYRRFLSNKRLGSLSPNYPGMMLVTPQSLMGVEIANPEHLAEPFYVSPMLRLAHMAKHYVRHHDIRDLMRYVAVAVDVGSLQPDEAVPFLETPYLVSGGLELGTYPAAWWIAAFSSVSRAALSFIECHAPARLDDPYQKRAVAFCQERLGSFFLLRELVGRYGPTLPSELFGSMHTVTEDAVYKGGV